MKFSLLQKPLKICGRIIKNKVVVPPMADFGMTKADGLVNDRHIEHYGNFANGGAGLIIIEACAVSQMNEPRNTIGLFSNKCIDGLKKLADASKQNGAVALVQIMETGLQTMEENSIAEIPEEKFLQYKADFVSAAARCKKAGFDGIELHAAHGMYLDTIIETSAREDGYGGCFENRVRILDELIRKIKTVCGKDFIVAVRFGNPNSEELIKTAKVIEDAGGDILDVSTGTVRYENIPSDFASDGKIYAASLVKQNSTLPVIGVGNISTGEQAENILKQGCCDMTAIGRGHLCDSSWANKTFNGETPNPCRRCRICMWYYDGRKCPAVK